MIRVAVEFSSWDDWRKWQRRRHPPTRPAFYNANGSQHIAGESAYFVLCLAPVDIPF